MEVAALVLSLVALVVSGAVSWRQLRLAQHANTLPVLVDLFREHRSVDLARARQFVHEELPGCDVSAGLGGLPEGSRDLVRELAWFYDNLGALVAHGVIDIAPVFGYLGGSVISVWESLEPVVLDNTGRPLDVVRDAPGKGRFHLCGATPLTVPEPWSRAAREDGHVLVVGLWHRSPDSIRGAVEDSEIVAVTAPLITD